LRLAAVGARSCGLHPSSPRPSWLAASPSLLRAHTWPHPFCLGGPPPSLWLWTSGPTKCFLLDRASCGSFFSPVLNAKPDGFSRSRLSPLSAKFCRLRTVGCLRVSRHQIRSARSAVVHMAMTIAGSQTLIRWLLAPGNTVPDRPHVGRRSLGRGIMACLRWPSGGANRVVASLESACKLPRHFHARWWSKICRCILLEDRSWHCWALLAMQQILRRRLHIFRSMKIHGAIFSLPIHQPVRFLLSCCDHQRHFPDDTLPGFVACWSLSGGE